MARRSNDPVRVREKILKQATEEFARIGFEGARVDRIAARCRVSKNMLYYYFKSKEGLFVAALEQMYQDLREQQKDLSVRASDPVSHICIEGWQQKAADLFELQELLWPV